MQDSTVVRYSTVLLRRSEEVQEKLLANLEEFEAFIVAQSYSGMSYDRAKDTEFTAVVHDGQVKFLRRVLDVETIDGWDNGIHFATSGRVPSFLKVIEGRPYPRNLRSVKYVVLCHDSDTDEVWIEDDNGRVC